MALCNVPFLIAERREATSTNTFTIKTRKLNVDGVIAIDTVSVSNSDTDGGIIHIGVLVGSTTYYIKTLTLTSKTHFYVVHPNIHINPESRIVVKVVTPTAGDTIYVNVFGYYEIPG